MTLAQAKARYKQITKQEASEDWTLEQCIAEIDKAKAEKQAKARQEAVDKYIEAFGQEPAAELTIEEIYKAIKAQGSSSPTTKTALKFKVHFGVEIPELKKAYTKQELEANEEICSYLHEIGSGAVEKL